MMLKLLFFRALAQAKVHHEQRHAVTLLLETVRLDDTVHMVTQHLLVGVDYIGIGCNQVSIDLLALGGNDTCYTTIVDQDALDRRVKFQCAANVLKQLGQTLDQGACTATGKPHATLALQCMNQRIDG